MVFPLLKTALVRRQGGLKLLARYGFHVVAIPAVKLTLALLQGVRCRHHYGHQQAVAGVGGGAVDVGENFDRLVRIAVRRRGFELIALACWIDSISEHQLGF